MFENAFPIEFIGGSRDGELRLATEAPEYLEVNSPEGWREVYERQTERPPFAYVQLGYVEKEQWN